MEEVNNNQSPSFEESVRRMLKTVPQPIRTAVEKGTYTTLAKELAAKHSLHVDQGGVLEREILLLLLGLENADEFAQTLTTDIGLPQKTVTSVIQDLNTRLFVPLREEMRKANPQQPASQAQTNTQPKKPTTPVLAKPVGAALPPRPIASPAPHFGAVPPPPKPQVVPNAALKEALASIKPKNELPPKKFLPGQEAVFGSFAPKKPEDPALTPPKTTPVPPKPSAPPEQTPPTSKPTPPAAFPARPMPIPAKPAAPVPPTPPKPVATPAVALAQQNTPSQPAPIKSAPEKYKLDPYREPIE